MKTIAISFLITVLNFTVHAALVTKSGYVSFYSHTPIENISAENFSVTSSIDINTGEIVYSVPIQAFEFPKAAMQKHFNNASFMNSKKFPKAKFKGKIANFEDYDLSKDGTYEVQVAGVMSIKGVNRGDFIADGKIVVSGNNIKIESNFGIAALEFGVEMPKKKKGNLASILEVTVKSEYVATE